MKLAALKKTPTWATYENARAAHVRIVDAYRDAYTRRPEYGNWFRVVDAPVFNYDDKERQRRYMEHLRVQYEAARSKVEALPEFTALGENAWEQLGW